MKIGEIWTTDDGSGCLGVVILAIIAGVIALPIMAGIWVWNAGENLIGYGTINQEVADVRATATAVTRKAEATAIALVPVEEDPVYYTNLVERAKITVEPISNFGYDENRDAVYFNLDFVNGDNQPHTVHMAFKDSGSGYKFERDILLYPGQNLQKIVEPPEPCVCVRFGGGPFGGMLLDGSGWDMELKLIDGFPLQDPRESLSKLTAEFSRGEQPGQCFIYVTNTDTLPHRFKYQVEFDYTYSELGELKRSSGITDGLGISDQYEINVNPMDTITLGHRPGRMFDFDGSVGILPSFPAHLSSITVRKVVLELFDPGTESIHPSIRTKTFTSSVCDYEK